MNASASTPRDPGIELARIFAMMFVVLVHIVNLGGLWQAAEPHGAQDAACVFLYALGVCGVNCYAMISGFVGVGSPYRPWKILPLWLQTLTTGLGVVLAFAIFAPDKVSGEDWLTACLPITFDEYWYVTAYVGVFFFFPFLNLLLTALTARGRLALIGAVFLVATILPMMRRIWIGDDLFALNAGYGSLWLALLYLAGGWLRLDGDRLPLPHGRSRKLLLFLALLILMGGFEILLSHLRPSTAKYAALGYDSPLTVLASFLFVAALRDVRASNPAFRKWIFLFGSASFGVFLIHSQPVFLRNLFSPDAFANLAELPALSMTLLALGATLVVYFLCALIETARIGLFAVLRVRSLSERLLRPLSNLLPPELVFPAKETLESKQAE